MKNKDNTFNINTSALPSPSNPPNLSNNLLLIDDCCNCLFCSADLIIPHSEKFILYFKKSPASSRMLRNALIDKPIYDMKNYYTVVV